MMKSVATSSEYRRGYKFLDLRHRWGVEAGHHARPTRGIRGAPPFAFPVHMIRDQCNKADPATSRQSFQELGREPTSEEAANRSGAPGLEVSQGHAHRAGAESRSRPPSARKEREPTLGDFLNRTTAFVSPSEAVIKPESARGQGRRRS